MKIMEKPIDNEEFKKSLDIFFEALNVDPTNDELQKQYLYFIARVYKSMKCYTDAIEYTTKALKIDPKFSLALLERAKNLYECQKFSRALSDIKAAMKCSLANSDEILALELRDKVLEAMSSNNNLHEELSDDQSSSSQSSSVDSLDGDENYNLVDDETGEGLIGDDIKESPSILYESKRFSALIRVFSPPIDGNLYEEPLQPKSALAAGFTKAKAIAQKFISFEKSQKTDSEVQADVKSAKGNREFTAQRFDKAIKYYSDAISLSPNTVFLLSRADCYMNIGNYKLALADATKSIEFDHSNWKSFSIAINCGLYLGDIKATENLIKRCKKFFGTDSIKFNELPKLETLKKCEAKIEKLYLEECFNDCLKQLQEARKVAKACERYQEMTLMCLILSNRFSIVDELIATELSKNPSNKNIPFMQALNFYYQCMLEESIDHFEMCLRPGCRVKEASEYLELADKMLEILNAGKYLNIIVVEDANLVSILAGTMNRKYEEYKAATKMLTNALTVDPSNKMFNRRIYFARATAQFQLQHLEDALDDYTRCLRIDERFVEALNGRARVHLVQKQFEDCILDCEESLEIEESPEVEKLLKDAKFFLCKKRKKETVYDVLNIPKKSSLKDARKAFRLLSVDYNSSRRPDATAVENRKIEYKLRRVLDAYKTITKTRIFSKLS